MIININCISNNKYLLNRYLGTQRSFKGDVIIQAKVLRQVSIYYLQGKHGFIKWMFFYRRIDLKDKSEFDV